MPAGKCNEIHTSVCPIEIFPAMNAIIFSFRKAVAIASYMAMNRDLARRKEPKE
jgi:hypothetical protein